MIVLAILVCLFYRNYLISVKYHIELEKMTFEIELKEIKSLLLKLNQKVDGLNQLVEEKLIGCEDPTKEDIEAITDYEAKKKNRKLSLVPLNELSKGT